MGVLLLLYTLFVIAGLFIKLDPQVPTWLIFLALPILTLMAIFAFFLFPFVQNEIVVTTILVLSIVLFPTLLWWFARLLIATYRWYFRIQ
jgi:hypothetical protein